MEPAIAGPYRQPWLTLATRQAPSLMADHEWRERIGQTLAGGHKKRGQLAFVLLAFVFTATMAGTPLPTPLYVIYQAQYGFSELMTSVLYATYAVAVITALLLAGRGSGQGGTR